MYQNRDPTLMGVSATGEIGEAFLTRILTLISFNSNLLGNFPSKNPVQN